MAKVRHDHKHEKGNHSSLVNSKKVPRFEVFRGWTTDAIKDDTGIAGWSKRRRETDVKAANSRKGHNAAWEPYVCNLNGHCQAIDDIDSFKYDSLNEYLGSQDKTRKTPIVKRHSVCKSGNACDADETGTGADESLVGAACRADQKTSTNRGENNPVSVEDKPQPGRQTTTAVSSPNSHVSECKTSDVGATTVGSNVITGTLESANDHDKVQIDSKDSPQRDDSPSCTNPILAETGHSGDGTSKVGDDLEQSVQQGVRLPLALFRLAYSRSNITLRDPYSETNCGADVEEDTPFSEESLAKVEDATESPTADSPIKTMKDARVNWMTNPLPISECITGHAIENGSKPKRETLEMAGANVTPPRDDSKVERKVANKPNTAPMQTQRQVSLVLTKVSLQDLTNNQQLPEDATPEPQNHATGGRRIVTGIPPSSAPPSERSFPPSLVHQMVPMGDLLPAVETNLKNRMVGRLVKGAYREDNDQLWLNTEKQRLMKPATCAAEPFMSLDEALLTADAADMTLRDRQFSMLGPPAFMPQQHKTPLQRAKEHTSKKLHSQINYNGLCYSDISRIRWSSSSGALYNANSPRRPDDTRSAPLLGRLSKHHKTCGRIQMLAGAERTGTSFSKVKVTSKAHK